MKPSNDPMAAIRETFFQECEEQLAELESGLQALDEGAADSETVNSVFRAVHSIKGGAGAFKLQKLVGFAHVFETALDRVRGGALAATTPVVRTLLRAADALADLVRAEAGGPAANAARVATLTGELEALESETSHAPEPPAEPAPEAGLFGFQPIVLDLEGIDEPAPPAGAISILFRPNADSLRVGNEPTRLLRELARLGDLETRCDSDALPALEALDPHGAYLGFRITLHGCADVEAVRDVFEFVADDCTVEIAHVGHEAPPAPVVSPALAPNAARFAPQDVAPNVALSSAADHPAPARLDVASDDGKSGDRREVAKAEDARQAAPGATSPSIRVDLDRVDRLINLVGELVINQAMLTQRVVEADLRRASGVAAALASLDQLTREIQEGVMAIRAQPVKTLFQRMSRIVREVAEATGKSVRLHTEGENVEVDRTVIERLADPLTHMIRNAVDHGLESPAARRAAGKPEQGEVTLTASHRSGRIVIEVGDDGAGIDRALVRAKAVERELIAPDAALSSSEIDNLLFLPGFSTASSVSELSGRGVGMDVVKRSIQTLGGRIAIASKPGEGTSFSMSLPLTLAVLDGMVVRVGGQTLVIPLAAIVETLRPKRGDVHGLGRSARLMADRGAFVPVIDIGREFGFRAEAANPTESVALVVETEVSTRCALVVDSIVDQRQVVIKSLETNYQNVTGIAAATILGDGRVALIIDIDAFVARASAGDSVHTLREAS